MRLPRLNLRQFRLLNCPTMNVLFQASRLITTSAHSLKRTYTEEPLKFTGSKAFKTDSTEAFFGPKHDSPKYQRYSVKLSVFVFIVYFVLLREENDIDEWLFDTLYIYASPDQSILELENRLKEEKLLGKDTTETEIKLKEVREKIEEVDRKQKQLDDYNTKLNELRKAADKA